MATQKELEELQEDLQPLVEAAIARGEDLSTVEHMRRFVERALEQAGYVQRGDEWIKPVN